MLRQKKVLGAAKKRNEMLVSLGRLIRKCGSSGVELVPHLEKTASLKFKGRGSGNAMTVFQNIVYFVSFRQAGINAAQHAARYEICANDVTAQSTCLKSYRRLD